MPVCNRILAAHLCGVSGLVVIFAMGARLFFDEELIISTAFGAMAGGAVCASLFGQRGRRGIALSALGAILATLIGSALAGVSFGLWVGPTLAGILYGPLTVGSAILTNPVIFTAWLATMAGAHLAMRVATIRPILPS